MYYIYKEGYGYRITRYSEEFQRDITLLQIRRNPDGEIQYKDRNWLASEKVLEIIERQERSKADLQSIDFNPIDEKDLDIFYNLFAFLDSQFTTDNEAERLFNHQNMIGAMTGLWNHPQVEMYLKSVNKDRERQVSYLTQNYRMIECPDFLNNIDMHKYGVKPVLYAELGIPIKELHMYV